MAIKREAVRAKAGASCNQMLSQATNAVNQLKAIKINILALKTQVENDTENFGQADIGDVQADILDIAAQIESI